MSKLTFLYSTMFGGKTTELLRTYDTYERKELKPIIIKPAIDNREGDFHGWGWTESRIIKEQRPAFYYRDLEKEVINNLNFKSIFLDEAQFATRSDILKLCALVDIKHIPVIAYGLKTDVNGNLFEGSSALLSLADEIKEIETMCQNNGCTNKAHMHLRYINGIPDLSGKTVAIEKDDVRYRAVCRKCWSKNR